MGYFDWHEQPGYFRDVTRHFDPSVRLLDVGCGTGWIADHFANYTGIDGSAEAVAQAQALGRNVIQGDASAAFPFADASFDAVIAKDLLEHVPDPTVTVTEILRVLAPGGVVFASSPDAQRWVWNDYTHRRPFTKVAFRKLFLDHGFEAVKVSYESVSPGIGIISGLTRRKRRPRIAQLAAQLPVVRRNVWALAQRPA